MKKTLILFIITTLTLSLFGCNKNTETISHTPGTPTEITVNANKEWYERLDFSDEKELENATRGLIEAPESVVIYNEDGSVAWSMDTLGNVSKEAPDTVNPSLWRNTQLNAYAGLFEVCERSRRYSYS